MCGIGGFFIGPDSTLLEAENIGKLRKFTTELLRNLEQHGKDASGLAIVRKDGIKIFKQPLKSSELVELESFKDFVKNNLTDETISVMAHARIPTCGSENDNSNNHPVVHGNVVGIHNGHIGNHDEIFEELKVKRTAEVDSEAIFALLNLAWDHEVKTTTYIRDRDYIDAVIKTTPFLKGTWAYVAVNARILDRMAIVRGGSSCVVINKLLKEKEKMLIFCTTLKTAEEAGTVSDLWDEVKYPTYEYLKDNLALIIKLDDKREIDITEQKMGG